MLESDKRRLKILGGVGAGLVAAVMGASVLMGGDDGATSSSQPDTVPAVATPSGSSSSSSAPEEDALFDDVRFEQARNPFAAPVDVTPNTSGIFEPTPTSGPTSPIDPSDPRAPSSTSFTPFPSLEPSDPTPTSLPSFDPAPVSTIAYLEYLPGPPEAAVLRVGDVVQTVSAGGDAGGGFLLVSLDGACAAMRKGEVPFSICVGEAILK